MRILVSKNSQGLAAIFIHCHHKLKTIQGCHSRCCHTDWSIINCGAAITVRNDWYSSNNTYPGWQYQRVVNWTQRWSVLHRWHNYNGKPAAVADNIAPSQSGPNCRLVVCHMTSSPTWSLSPKLCMVPAQVLVSPNPDFVLFWSHDTS